MQKIHEMPHGGLFAGQEACGSKRPGNQFRVTGGEIFIKDQSLAVHQSQGGDAGEPIAQVFFVDFQNVVLNVEYLEHVF